MLAATPFKHLRGGRVGAAGGRNSDRDIESAVIRTTASDSHKSRHVTSNTCSVIPSTSSQRFRHRTSSLSPAAKSISTSRRRTDRPISLRVQKVGMFCMWLQFEDNIHRHASERKANHVTRVATAPKQQHPGGVRVQVFIEPYQVRKKH